MSAGQATLGCLGHRFPGGNGLENGMLAGRVQVLQELLGDSISCDDELMSTDSTALTTKVSELQQRLRDRQA